VKYYPSYQPQNERVCVGMDLDLDLPKGYIGRRGGGDLSVVLALGARIGMVGDGLVGFEKGKSWEREGRWSCQWH
jgi:hypothetical protein